MNFFQHFQTTPYTFQVGNTSFESNITNLTQHVKIVEQVKQHVTVYYDYVVQEGDRPDTVALKVYNGVVYTWLVLVINNIFSLYDWPLSGAEFQTYITNKYGSIPAALAAMQYSTVSGHLVDTVTYNLLPVVKRAAPKSLYDVELLANEQKRRIKVVPAVLAGALTLELQKVLANVS